MERIPVSSAINYYAKDAYFVDCFSTIVRYENQSALDMFLLMAYEAPSWVNFLMYLRNKFVSIMGIKDLGKLSDVVQNKSVVDYKVGDKVGIFKLYANLHHEIILEDIDKHLGVKVSFYIEPNGCAATVYVSTVVHVNNTLGRAYMFFVAPVHKIIVPSLLKKLPLALL